MQQYKKTRTVFLESLGSRAVLLNVEENSYFSLNESAKWLWECLCDGKSLDDCVSEGLERFEGVGEDELRRDFEEILRTFLSEKVLELR